MLDPHRHTIFACSLLGQRLFEAIINAISDSQISIEVLQLRHIEDNKRFEDSSFQHKRNCLYQPPITSIIQGFYHGQSTVLSASMDLKSCESLLYCAMGVSEEKRGAEARAKVHGAARLGA